MYFGSVRFFKHLIVSLFVIILAVIIVLGIFYGGRFLKERSEIKPANGSLAESSSTSSPEPVLPEGVSVTDVLGLLRERGFSDKEILEAIGGESPDLLSEIYTIRYGEGGLAPVYTELYSDLYVAPPPSFSRPLKTVYLTFDDGPSANTVDILSILNKHQVPATFFMNGSDDPNIQKIMKSVAEAGMAIGVHSSSHEYDEIYSDVQSYLEDFYKTSRNIEDVTGIKPDIFRFPGGSINNYNRFVYPQLIAEMTRRGYVYHDWDVSGEDAVKGATWTSIYRSVLNGVSVMGEESSPIILLHDAADKGRTVLVLEDLIVALKEKGYSFGKLDNSVMPTTFGYIS